MFDLLTSIQQDISFFESDFQFSEHSTLDFVYTYHLWFEQAKNSFNSLNEHVYQYLFST